MSAYIDPSSLPFPGAAREAHSREGTVFARQPCCHIPNSRELGQWLCVPPFRVVCPWRVLDVLANVIGYRAPARPVARHGHLAGWRLQVHQAATEVPAGRDSTAGGNAIRSGLQIEALTVASNPCRSVDRRSGTADVSGFQRACRKRTHVAKSCSASAYL